MPTRRTVLAGGTASILGIKAAAAGFFGGAIGGGGGAATLATLTLVNTSGSTQSANFVTQSFGHPFKKGDVPTSTYPQFIRPGGSACPYTMWGQSYWSDGSLKAAGFMLLVGDSIAGSSSIAITVKNGGSAPSASSRATSDLTAANLVATLTGIDNLSGAWASTLTDLTDVKVVGDGGAGKVWRIRVPFKQSGSAHGQLECYHYVTALQASGGGLYGLRWLPRVTQPWLDVDSPAKSKRDFTCALTSAGSTSGITQPSTGSAKTFTATNGNPIITCTGHGFEMGAALRPSSSGTLPGGFSSSTTVYVRFADANSFQLHPTAFDALSNSNTITPSSSGTGTHTLTPHIEIVHFASFFGANADGTWQYIQGGGSVAAECTVRPQFDKAYWISTRLIPPWDRTQSANPPTSVNYKPDGKGALHDEFGGSGGHNQIGVQPNWTSQHFLGQDATSERVTRVSALSMGVIPFCVKRSSTGVVPAINNTTYTGMGTAVPTMRWAPWNTVADGFTIPTGDITGAIEAANTSHWPSAIYYPILIFGSPELFDLMVENAQYAVMVRIADNSRNPTVSATTYYGATFRDSSQARTDAWGSRELGLAAAITPAAHWENASLSTYFNDMMTAGYQSINAYNALQSSFWTDNGIYHFRQDDQTGAPWQHNFLILSVSMVYAATESSDALTFLNHCIKWPKAVDADVGIYHWTSFTTRMRATDGASALVTAMSQIYYMPNGDYSCSSTAATDLISLVASNCQFTITQGDGLYWMATSPAPSSTPSTAQTPLFARQVTDPGISSTKTIKVATTNSDATIADITSTGATGSLCLRMQTIPASGKGLAYTDITDTYNVICYAAMRYAESVGANSMTTLRTKTDAIIANNTITWDSDPRFKFQVGFA